ncbi:MAG: carbon-nitrogen hydrolase family protein [Terriglobia bacterium]
MDRRTSLKMSAVGLGSLAAGLGFERPGEAAAASAPPRPAPNPDAIGRPVRVVSIGFHPGYPLERIVSLVDREGTKGADIIVIPETCRGLDATSGETIDGPTVTAMARLARKHSTYVVCPIDRRTDGERHNSAVLLDRGGKVVCIYDKIYPVWQQECLQKPPVLPGRHVQVYQADFGRVGFAICFDVNWSPLWEGLSNQNAELVIWPSAYSAGRSLQARAIDYNYYVVSSTWIPDCHVFDIDGEQLIYDKNNQGREANVTRVTLDLDRCIFHQDLNLPEKLHRLLAERGDDIEQEKWLALEGWFVLKAKRPGVSCRELARQYGLEELRHYINRSRCEIDKCRGWEFS